MIKNIIIVVLLLINIGSGYVVFEKIKTIKEQSKTIVQYQNVIRKNGNRYTDEAATNKEYYYLVNLKDGGKAKGNILVRKNGYISLKDKAGVVISINDQDIDKIQKVYY